MHAQRCAATRHYSDRGHIDSSMQPRLQQPVASCGKKSSSVQLGKLTQKCRRYLSRMSSAMVAQTKHRPTTRTRYGVDAMFSLTMSKTLRKSVTRSVISAFERKQARRRRALLGLPRHLLPLAVFAPGTTYVFAESLSERASRLAERSCSVSEKLVKPSVAPVRCTRKRGACKTCASTFVVCAEVWCCLDCLQNPGAPP